MVSSCFSFLKVIKQFKNLLSKKQIKYENIFAYLKRK